MLIVFRSMVHNALGVCGETMLANSKYPIITVPLGVYKIPHGVYTIPTSGVFTIELDTSSATYLLAVAAITGTYCMLASIGLSSLQGDTCFAKEVLEPMGCTVVWAATEMTVTGPPIRTLKAMPEVDMEPITDAFLMAAIVGAVATGGGLGGEGVVGQERLVDLWGREPVCQRM